MSFELLLQTFAVFILLLLLIAIVRAVADRAYTKIAAKERSQNIELKKKNFDLMGAEPVLANKLFDRSRNVAILKTRGLIIDYVFWEKASDRLRLALSAATGFLFAILLAGLARDFNQIDAVNFVFVGLFFFGVAYLFWGNILEVFWKARTLAKIKGEFGTVIRFAVEPMKEFDNFAAWMKAQGAINDDTRDELEGILQGVMKAVVTKE